jgi:hypothetical protein
MSESIPTIVMSKIVKIVNRTGETTTIRVTVETRGMKVDRLVAVEIARQMVTMEVEALTSPERSIL